jgi:hypothetical protein
MAVNIDDYCENIALNAYPDPKATIIIRKEG